MTPSATVPDDETMGAAEEPAHRAEKWTHFSASNDAPLEDRSIGSIPKVESTFGSDAVAELPPGAGQASGARALVSLDGDEPERARIVRPLTGFLAQLLACRDGAPQMRARRRAGAGEAVRSYRVPAAGCGARALSKRI